MAEFARLCFQFRSAMAPALAALLLMLFIGYAVVGPNGVLAWGNYSRQLKDKEAELRVVEAQRAEIANRVNLLDGRHADPDMVDELLRRRLNVLHPDDVVVPMN